MKGPYGLELNDGCKTCSVRGAGFFCQLPAGAVKDFDAIKSTATYPKGALLFVEKQETRGVYVLCQGEVKLSISSADGKTLIMRIARAGELLGLMAAMAELPYEVTAETIHPCQVAFVRKDDFVRFLAKHVFSISRRLRAIAHHRTFDLGAGKTGAIAAHLDRRNPADQGRHAHQAAPDARRDCGIYRHHARDGDANPQRFQGTPPGFHPGIHTDDSEPRGA
jgi:CRP-like cAMP-binding protein